MIKVVLYTKANVLNRFTLCGHANMAKKGSDIVCAAVSTLVINTINYIESHVHEKLIVTTNKDTALIDCTFPNAKDNSVSIQAGVLIDAMVFGLKSLEEQYGKYINISEEAFND